MPQAHRYLTQMINYHTPLKFVISVRGKEREGEGERGIEGEKERDDERGRKKIDKERVGEANILRTDLFLIYITHTR